MARTRRQTSIADQARRRGVGSYDGGTYAVLLYFDRPRELVYGKNQTTVRPGPLAVYIGSMRRGLAARIERHLGIREKNALQWDIDYVPLEVTVRREGLPLPRRYDECGLVQAIVTLPGAEPVRGFGNKDCKKRCVGHLVKIPRKQIATIRNLAVGIPCRPAMLSEPHRGHADYLLRTLRSRRARSFGEIVDGAGPRWTKQLAMDLRRTAAALGVHIEVQRGGVELWRLRRR